jgi:hypothetical protein
MSKTVEKLRERALKLAAPMQPECRSDVDSSDSGADSQV